MRSWCDLIGRDKQREIQYLWEKQECYSQCFKITFSWKVKSWNRLYLANSQIKNTCLGWQKKVMFIHLTYFNFLSVLKYFDYLIFQHINFAKFCVNKRNLNRSLCWFFFWTKCLQTIDFDGTFQRFCQTLSIQYLKAILIPVMQWRVKQSYSDG